MADAASKSRDFKQAVGDDAPTQAPSGLDATLPLRPGMTPGFPHSPAKKSPTHLGPYELLEMLGQGGMGTVWKARHTKLDKLVALKLLPPHLMTDADAVARFEREMRAVGKLEHAHIVRAMDAGEADGIHYLVMEYIEGIDLARLVKQRGPRSVVDACQMIRHAALGLAHAHEHGLVHRDIKPSNLLLSKKGLVKILDLGLARLASEKTVGDASLTIQGEVMGTPDYMAPEQWQSAHTVGPAADLYALGCTLHFLLTGQAPFCGEQHSSFGQKMSAHVLQSPPPLPNVPPDVEALYQKLLAKEPATRPVSAKEVADELRTMMRSWTKSPAPVETIPWTPAVSATAGATGRRFLPTVGSRGRIIAAACAAAMILVGGVATRMSWSPQPRSTTAERDDNKDSERVGAAPMALMSAKTPAPALAIAPFDAERAKARQKSWADYLGVPVEYENSLGMRFMLIPPGEFNRGTEANRIAALQENFKKSVEGKLDADNQTRGMAAIASESPSHRVRISRPFYLAVCEVTQRAFEQILGQNRSYFGPTGAGFDGKAPRTRMLPVENISFEEAVEFCRRLTDREEIGPASGYRLPTDAEWEYACRAGTTGPFWFGGPTQDVTPFARWGEGSPMIVGKHKPNPFGLIDMHGNVCELCQDFFAADEFARYSAAITDSPTGPVEGTAHIARGGGYADVGVMCRSSSRRPFFSPQSNVSFRPVLAVEAVQKKRPPGATAINVETAAPNELFQLGRNLCFLNDQWEKGLPLLAKANHDAIRAAALKELNSSLSPEEQVEMGTLWYTAAGTAEEPDNWHCYRRARFWLNKALSQAGDSSGTVWHEAAQRQLQLVPMLRATLRIKTHGFNSETIIISRNQVEWISRDGAGPNVLSDATSRREFVSFNSQYGMQDRHVFDLSKARWLLPEAIDFTTARLRVVKKEGRTGANVRGMIDKERSDPSKVVVRITEWDNHRKAGTSYLGDFEVEALLSFGAPD